MSSDEFLIANRYYRPCVFFLFFFVQSYLNDFTDIYLFSKFFKNLMYHSNLSFLTHGISFGLKGWQFKLENAP